MKLGFIVPNDQLHLVKGNDFHLCLAHLVEASEIYRNFYKAESENGAEIILDNSSFELGDNVYTPEQLIEFAKQIGATAVMAPETYLDANDTVKKVKEFCEGGIDFPVFATIHGTTYGEIKHCYSEVIKIPQVKYVGFSCRLQVAGLSYKHIPNLYNVDEDRYRPLTSSLNKGLNRAALLADLTNTGVLDMSVKHHLLGLNHPFELSFYTNCIYSHDSSAAYISGLERIAITDIMYEKSKKAIGDFEGSTPTESQLSFVKDNMQAFRDLVEEIAK